MDWQELVEIMKLVAVALGLAASALAERFIATGELF